MNEKANEKPDGENPEAEQIPTPEIRQSPIPKFDPQQIQDLLDAVTTQRDQAMNANATMQVALTRLEREKRIMEGEIAVLTSLTGKNKKASKKLPEPKGK